MLATYACAAAICGLSLGAGALVCRLGGAQGWSWLAPGAGMATLLCVATVAVRLPGHGWTALALLAVLAIAGLAPFARRRGAELGGPAAGPRAGASQAIAAALIVLAAVSIPFALSGRLGLLGTGINDDLGFHLAWAESLANGSGADRLIDQLDPGYPIAPHSVAAAPARPFGVLEAFTGLMMAVPVLTALTALAALADLRPGWRVAGTVATALPYMAISYYAQGAFKEPVLALVVLTFAISLGELGGAGGWRRGLVPGLAAVAGVLTFGTGALAWPLAITALWLAAELALRRREWLPRLRRMAPALLAAAAVLGASMLANLDRLQNAGLSGSFSGGGDPAGGNFIHQLSIWRMFGGWPSPDFRLAAENDVWVAIATVIAVLAVLYAAVWWTRRRELALPAAALGSLLVYLYARGDLAAYHSAKAMVVAAPLLTLLAVRAAFAGLPGPEHPRLVFRSGSAARALLGVGFVAVVLWSSGLALWRAPVSANDHAQELRSLRPLLRSSPTLLLVSDPYARWELLDVPLGSLTPYGYLPEIYVEARPDKPVSPADFDTLPAAELDLFRFAVTARGPYSSEPPPNWRVVRSTDSFQVWKRNGRTPRRRILEEGDSPGAGLRCPPRPTGQMGQGLGIAAVRRPPVVGPVHGWRGSGGAAYVDSSGRALVPDGVAVAQTLRLPRGRWDLSLQYASPVSLQVRAGKLSEQPPAVTDPLGQYWPIGSVSSLGGRVRVEVEVPNARLGAIDRGARLGKVVASPAPWRVTELPLRRACGRYVDFIQGG